MSQIAHLSSDSYRSFFGPHHVTLWELMRCLKILMIECSLAGDLASAPSKMASFDTMIPEKPSLHHAPAPSELTGELD